MSYFYEDAKTMYEWFHRGLRESSMYFCFYLNLEAINKVALTLYKVLAHNIVIFGNEMLSQPVFKWSALILPHDDEYTA